MNTPSVLIGCNDHNAENPIWHPQHRCLYWSDIPEGRLFRYDPKDQEYEQIYSGEPVGGFTIQADGALLLFKTEGTVEIWKEGDIIPVIPSIPEAKGTRFNDAIADRKGRVYSGIMATEDTPGRLYRIDLDGSYHAVVEDLLVPNGMAFDLDYTHFYLTDSEKRIIYRFDYDEETGELSNQTTHLTTPENDGIPDGMTIDAAGHLWSARWNGSGIHHYHPTGKHHSKIELPVKKVSCITFGGDNYDSIFISTARGDDPTPEESRYSNAAGDIFHMKSDVKGRPERFSCILLAPYSYDTAPTPIQP
ncbi:MAG: SMP-30/gluconolactonase/LRE family protein [Phormidesmis sp.]